MHRQVSYSIHKTKLETELQMEELFKEKEVILFNRYDNEKQDLCDRIRELEHLNEDHERARVKLLERHFISKWLFFTWVHKIQGAKEETKRQLAERTERMLIEREMRLQDISKIKDEHSGFKEENFKLLNVAANLKYEIGVSASASSNVR